MRKLRRLLRPVVTLALLAGAYACFLLPAPSRTITEIVSASRTLTTTEHTSARFFDWLGILMIALALWIWRDLLKLTAVGPLSGLPLTQQAPADIRQLGVEVNGDGGDDQRQQTDVETKVRAREDADAQEYVLNFLKERHALTEDMLASDLRIPVREARFVLSDLSSQGILRRDGFPRHTLYTSASSLENRALDYVRDRIVTAHYRLLNERRFVRIASRYEADAVLECEERTFVVEVRYLQSRVAGHVLESGVTQLRQVGILLAGRNMAGILLLVVRAEGAVAAVTRSVALTSTDAGDIPIRIHVVAEADLKGDAGYS